MDRATVDAAVLDYVAKQPDKRGEEVAAAVGFDFAAVRRSLNGFVANSKMYVDGAGRGARFKMVPVSTGAAEAQP